jgi:putative spermidine/putrescine transport system ATP-binding protein
VSSLLLSGIVKRYGTQAVVDGLDFSIRSGEFVSLLGPSGCGKTTLLRIIAGLIACDAGRVVVGDTDVTKLPAHRRNIGVVFQSYALFPHLTVGENIAFGLKAHGVQGTELAAGVSQALKAVQLSALADRPISALSGGQQQRVAVARAIATRPRLILLDEPLSALDRKLRETMQIELRQMLRDAGMTAIFVTHDQEEALVMSDRIAVMNHGRIEQFDAPDTIYARPSTPFALNFVGLSSQWHGEVSRVSDTLLTVQTDCGTIDAPLAALPDATPGARVLVGVRPEMIEIKHLETSLAPLDAVPRNRLAVTVGETVFLGSRRLVYFQSQQVGANAVMAEVATNQSVATAPGDQLQLSWPVGHTLVYPMSASH